MLIRYELTMMKGIALLICSFLKTSGKLGRPRKDNRVIFHGIIWILRSRAPWRDLPERYGLWEIVYSRFRKWMEDGVLGNIFRILSLDAELAELFMDDFNIKAHQYSTGAKRGVSSRNWPQQGRGRHKNPCSCR